jgi:hypothetical protein
MQKINRQQQFDKVNEDLVAKYLKCWQWAYNHGTDKDRAVWFHRLSCACEKQGKKAIDVISDSPKTSKS